MEQLTVARVDFFAPGSESADVTLRSDRGEIVVFSYPCEVAEGDVIPNRLSGLTSEALAAYLNDWPESEKEERSQERLEKIGPYAYRGCGRVVNQAEGLIEVLGFVIDLGEVPCDGHIEFECERIDL
ncbi:hypothetical protein EON83_29925 [bacterium]|nr:MAG: hypothetical protein EON83_29925 [bacterium]